jgi:hypothetical protein
MSVGTVVYSRDEHHNINHPLLLEVTIVTSEITRSHNNNELSDISRPSLLHLLHHVGKKT